jgi:putative transposase
MGLLPYANHTHLIAMPEKLDSLSSAIGEAHRRYSRMINFREGWRGYLWQGRFSSFVMDEARFIASIRYIERNPVRAKLVTDPGDYRFGNREIIEKEKTGSQKSPEKR